MQGSTPVPRTWTLAYDANGYLASVTDPLQVVTSYHNDADGRTTDTFLPRPGGGTRDLQTGYDADSNLASVTLARNASQEEHQLVYTAGGELSSYAPPSVGSGTWSTTDQYDQDHSLHVETRPDGNTIIDDYDSAYGATTFTYGRNGELQSKTTGSNVMSTSTTCSGISCTWACRRRRTTARAASTTWGMA